MQILVVDDEMVSRIKMETVMQTFGQCTTVRNGNLAIEHYQSALKAGSPYELVMLDIDMPDLLGTEVLHKIRQMEDAGSHRATVVMVTGQLNRNQVVKCIQEGCDDYIAKPFNINIIRAKLQKLGLIDEARGSDAEAPPPSSPAADAIFKGINDALGSNELSLPSIPQVGIKFREMVQNNRTLDELVDLLNQDAVIATKLIRLANSAIYRGYEKSQNLEKAISRIGLLETEQIVMAISNKRLFMVKEKKYLDLLNEVWMHSLATAYATEILSQSLAKTLTINPFTAGLFHDIGALAMIHIIAGLEKRGRYDEKLEPAAVHETVQRNHAVFGAKLMEKWEFPNDYIRTVLYHNNFHGAEALSDELLMVHFSNLLAKQMGYTAYGKLEAVDLMAAPSTRELRIVEPQIKVLKHHVQSKMSRAAEFGS